MSQQSSSLRQYQQSLQNSMEKELLRQEQQNAPGKDLTDKLKTAIEQVAKGFMDGAIQAYEESKQYGKEVVTFQKFWEGMSNDQGFLDTHISRGAADVVNQLWLGQPAPVYPHARSPADLQLPAGGVHGEAAISQNQLEAGNATSAEPLHRGELQLYQQSLTPEQQPEVEREIAR